MSWINENKFVAGFSGFMVVGVGVFGFLFWKAAGDYSAVHDDYTAKLQTLNTLQSMAPYPNDQNLKAYNGQKASLATAISGLEDNLAQIQFPLEPMTPEQFQDKLRLSVNSVLAKAKLNSVKLPDKFAMGFDQYLSAPPSKDAAAPLGRELKTIEFFINELLDSRIISIAATPSMTRAPIAEETKVARPKSSVIKSMVEISFVVDQSKFRKILNDIVETKKQFYIIRMIQIKNQAEKSPARSTKRAANDLSYILGTEKLIVSMRLEIINFNPSQK